MCRWGLLFLTLFVLVGCCVGPSVPPDATSSLRLPTRVPATAAPSADPRGYYEAGLACRKAGDTECALQSFTLAIQADSGFAPGYVARGSIYLAQGDLVLALADADSAVAADATSATAHILRGETLRLLGRDLEASDAFDRAVVLDPALAPDLFRSRWLAALESHDGVRLFTLANEYNIAHPDTALGYYYRGWALVEKQNPQLAIGILIKGIESAPNAPALLWFALGHAYLKNKSWQEAVIALETAGELISAGDTSLEVHTEHPLVDFFGALGIAYLKVGRCADAERALEYAIAVGASPEEYSLLLRESRLCKTPQPTFTPYPTTTPSVD